MSGRTADPGGADRILWSVVSNAQGSQRGARGECRGVKAGETFDTVEPPLYEPLELREPDGRPEAYEADKAYLGTGPHVEPEAYLRPEVYPEPEAVLPRRHVGRRRKPDQAAEATPAPTPTPSRSASSLRSQLTAENLRRLVPQALVVAFLVGGTSAFLAYDKAVKLSVDGVPRTMHTFADDVKELLADEGVAVGAHDIVAPGPGADLASGDEVVVRYGRPVLLTLDGHRRRVWTTARTVDGALRQLGVRAEGAFLSVSRSYAIARHGVALGVRTERSVTFMADGRERTVRTNAATVAEALVRAGITLRGQDTTSAARDSFPRGGQTISVLRITAREEVREEAVPYDKVTTRDASLFQGTEVVAQRGRQGARRVTFGLRTVNGVRQKPRKLHEEIVREPVTERVRVGTKPRPMSVAGADGLNWGALAACESGGRPGAVDPSGNYGGLYQFDTGTWHTVGGRGRPQDAPASEQTYRAKKLYVRRGAAPWPHCGSRLTG